MKFGCHVSIAGGVFNAPENARVLGCEVFQIFSRSPQGGPAPELTAEVVKRFFEGVKKGQFSEYIVHTPYFINYGSASNRIYYGSISVVRQELERASMLGARYVVTHLGSYTDLGEMKGLVKVVTGLVKTLDGYKNNAQLLIENSAGSGNIIGDDFKELAKIIKHKNLKKYNLGVCFDTAHAFASGYDLRSSRAVAKTLSEFDKIVGIEKIKIIHINGSAADLGARRDRHEHIGKGKIGRDGIAAVVKYPKLKKINMYLETEHDLVKEDLKILKEIRDGKLTRIKE